jgi:hypothetical protein
MQQDVEADLSYACLCAIAAKAGMSCKPGNRNDDNKGIDAHITAWGLPGLCTEVDLKIQLKATSSSPTDDGACFSYFLRGVSQYDDLRSETVSVPRILVVLFMPESRDQWVSHDPEQLILRRCAYGQSLRGLPPSTNTSGQTVKIPKTQMFSPENLKRLMDRISHRDIPTCETRFN